MKIQFVEEDLNDRIGLYIDPEQPLTSYLTHVQDGIEAEGIRVDRKFKYVKGKLCKFFIELVSEPNSELIQKRKKLVESINLNLQKIKWDIRSTSYILHIGKIGDKEIFITVAKFFNEVSQEEIETIKEITQKVTNKVLNIKNQEQPKITHNAPKYTPPPPPVQIQPSFHPFTQRQNSRPPLHPNTQQQPQIYSSTAPINKI